MSDAISVVLAAGRGTRMNSDLPKVLLPVCGRPMIHYVLDALEAASVRRHLVVVGYQADQVRSELKDRSGVDFVEQAEQLGTGHAVQMCRSKLAAHDGTVVVLAGDSPLVQPASLQRLRQEFEASDHVLLLGTLNHPDPTGLGRVVRDADGSFVGIVEHKDATDEQRQIREVNMSTYFFDCHALLDALGELSSDNQQGEYYLTDCAEILRRQGRSVEALPVLQPCEALSINTREQLSEVEMKMRELGYA